MSCRDTALHRAFYAIFIITVLSLVGCTSKAPGELPSVNLLLLDSVTVFNTSNIEEGKPIILIYFRPYCKHCREETEAILKNYKHFKDIQLVFVSADELDKVRLFARYYNLQHYKSIQVAWDNDFNFYHSFKPRAIPYQVLYNRSRKLIKAYNGQMKWTQLIQSIKGS